MNNLLHFSSDDTTWETPQWLYDKLDSIFHFTLDPCCSLTTRKCSNWFTEKENGLIQQWTPHTVFMNPPYNKPRKACNPNCKSKVCATNGYHVLEDIPGQSDWITKAANSGTPVVALIPARTDTTIWQECILTKATTVCLLKGRLKFGTAENAAPFPSALVVFNTKCTIKQFNTLRTLGYTFIV